MNELDAIFDQVMKDKIRTIPEKTRIIETAKEKGRLLAVRGDMDYIEKILPYCYTAKKEIINSKSQPPNLDEFDVVFVGCPGDLNLSDWKAPLLKFLNAGGVLLTTDWTLSYVTQKMFPKFVCNAGEAEGTFPIRVRQPNHRLLEGIPNCSGTPWVVEVSSHRIGIKDTSKVQVILDAPSMGLDSSILIAFEVGKGMLVHAISHFHLQGSEQQGEYISAYILTNVIDEAIRRRHPAAISSRIRVINKATGKQPLHIRVIKKT